VQEARASRLANIQMETAEQNLAEIKRGREFKIGMAKATSQHENIIDKFHARMKYIDSVEATHPDLAAAAREKTMERGGKYTDMLWDKGHKKESAYLDDAMIGKYYRDRGAEEFKIEYKEDLNPNGKWVDNKYFEPELIGGGLTWVDKSKGLPTQTDRGDFVTADYPTAEKYALSMVEEYKEQKGKEPPKGFYGKKLIEYKRAQAAEIGKASEARETGKAVGVNNMTQYTAANTGVANIAQIDKLRNHLRDSEAITGLGAEFFKNIERVKTLMGSRVAEGKVSDTEVLDAMMGKEVFPLIKALGVGARGLDTPAEREFMRNVLTGNIPLNRETLLAMADMRREIAERAIITWNSRTETGELDRFYNATGIPKEKIEIPRNTVTVVNPDTNQEEVWDLDTEERVR
jgi:hypothetical protein